MIPQTPVRVELDSRTQWEIEAERARRGQAEWRRAVRAVAWRSSNVRVLVGVGFCLWWTYALVVYPHPINALLLAFSLYLTARGLMEWMDAKREERGPGRGKRTPAK